MASNIESRLIDVEGKIIALDAKINTLAVQVQRLAEPASDRSKLRNRVAKVDDLQGLKILMLELASDMDDVRERLDLLDGKNRQSSKATTRRPQSDSGE